MSETLKVVYPGLDKKTWDAQMASVEGVSDLDKKFYPREPKKEFFYYNKTKDSDAEKSRKAARRKRFREQRKQEVLEGLQDVDAVREVCGYVFEKDEAKLVNLDKLIPEEREKFFQLLERKELLHYDEWKLLNETDEERAAREAKEKAEAEAAEKEKEKARQKLKEEIRREVEAELETKKEEEKPVEEAVEEEKPVEPAGEAVEEEKAEEKPKPKPKKATPKKARPPGPGKKA